ncbi:hypothetical protein HYDPIDRAFT_167065 [Hydnomerulius pinastri MD-312]|nr:hypothetical protein HYDPIDRAFT_167065 [Hydnomerulius pinastri MD-312]
MAPVAVTTVTSTESIHIDKTFFQIRSHVVSRYPKHELSFITSSAHDSSIQTKTFSTFNQYVRTLAQAMRAWGKPTGSVIVVYLTEHEDNMAAVWACMLAGYVPCLQPALSAQQEHKEGHITHISNLLSSMIWLTNDSGAEQIKAIAGLDIHLFSELKASTETLGTKFTAHQPRPDDEAILFLTSGSTGRELQLHI